MAAELRGSLQASSFANQWSIVKLFINFGVTNGKIVCSNLYDSIKVERKAKKVEYLTMEELNRIRTTPYTTPSLQRVADIAILQASLGLAYCDLMNICRSDIREQPDVKFIQKQRAKTGVEYITVVSSEALDILNRYDYNIGITNQANNRFLKIIALQAGITKKLHSHVARHSISSFSLKTNDLQI